MRGGAFSEGRHNDPVVGTPAYMAPEQFYSPDAADVRTDVYQLGLLLYEMLSGRAANGELGIVEIASSVASQQNLPSLAEVAPDVPRLTAKMKWCHVKIS